MINPTTFTITDAIATAEGVTGFNIHLGRVSGVYTLSAPVPAADLSTEASGQITGKIADLNLQLAPGDWFAVATAVSAGGESGFSPELAFTIVAVPSPPSGFFVA
jgi:hypothetical protein